MTPTGPSPRPVRTVFIGSGGFGVPSLRELATHPAVDLVGVITAPPRAAGRRLGLAETPIAAASAGLGDRPVLTPIRLRAPEAIAEVLALEPELAVLADYGQLLPSALLDLPNGALNLHPSLLPRHRGASPIPATILAGDEETGVSLMRMDAGLDTGPLLAVEHVALDGSEIAPELEASLADLGAALLARSLEPWLGGDLVAVPQSADGMTLTRPLRREDGRLDPARPAHELARQVRAHQPWPGSYLETDAGRVTIWVAEARRGGAATPGRIGAFGLSTSDGTLVIEEVQPAGGRRMSWEAYLRGRPALVDSMVGPAG